jgi:hypothetical protein
MQSSVYIPVFLYTNNKLSEEEIRKKNCIHNSLIKNYLGIKLTKVKERPL